MPILDYMEKEPWWVMLFGRVGMTFVIMPLVMIIALVVTMLRQPANVATPVTPVAAEHSVPAEKP